MSQRHKGRLARRGGLATLASLAATAALAATASLAGAPPAFAAQKVTGPIRLAMFQNFSGVGASFAPETEAACISAATLANSAGGILGHQVQCVPANSGSDPADAVTEANRMAATIGNLEAVIGATSDVIDSTVGIFQQDHLPVLTNSGQPQFTHTKDQYFWRLVPPDSQLGVALATYAVQHYGKRVAMIFTNDAGAQADEPTTLSTLRTLHADVTTNQSIAPDASSYRSEVEKVLSGHPSSIVMEMSDPQTAATYFGELKQLNHGKLIPIVSVTLTLAAPWIQAVAPVVGGPQVLAKMCTGMAEPYTVNSGPAYESYKQALLSPASKAVPTPIAWAYNPAAEGQFEGTALFLLAMQEAHSLDPQVWNPWVTKVANGVPGAVDVSTLPEGLKAIEAGHKVRYVGLTGALEFDRWHSAPTGFGAFHCAIGPRPKSLIHYTVAYLSSIAAG